VLQGARRNEQGNVAGTMQAQHSGTFVGRGTGSHDIVDQYHIAAAKIAAAGEGAAHITLPFAG
jgi:hypothetical protein